MHMDILLLTETHLMYLLLMRGGLRRHIGGGGGILRGGDGLRGGGRTRWVSTADAVISCPSIWPINNKVITESYPTRMHRVILQNRGNRTLWPTSVHVFEGFLGLVRSLKLNISVAPGQMRVVPVYWHFDHFDFSISGKDLLDVVLCKKKDTKRQNHVIRKL